MKGGITVLREIISIIIIKWLMIREIKIKGIIF